MAADRSPQIGVLEFGRAILHDEARALDALADQLGAPFETAVELICSCRGKLIVSGLGKSGHVARKIAATFASTGTTAVFLHLAEAIHGDIGMAAEGVVAGLRRSSNARTPDGSPVEGDQSARRTYSPVSVSTTIFSPTPMYGGIMMRTPLLAMAGL